MLLALLFDKFDVTVSKWIGKNIIVKTKNIRAVIVKTSRIKGRNANETENNIPY